MKFCSTKSFPIESKNSKTIETKNIIKFYQHKILINQHSEVLKPDLYSINSNTLHLYSFILNFKFYFSNFFIYFF